MATFHFIVQRAANNSWSTQSPEFFLITAASYFPFGTLRNCLWLWYNVKIENFFFPELVLTFKSCDVGLRKLIWLNQSFQTSTREGTKLRTGFTGFTLVFEYTLWKNTSKQYTTFLFQWDSGLASGFVFRRGKGRYNLYSFNVFDVFVGLSDCPLNASYYFYYYFIIPRKRPWMHFYIQATYQFFY